MNAEETGPLHGWILVVDDDPAQCRLVRRVLGREYRVRSATSAGEALPLLDSSWSLLILDIHLPGTGGLELLRAARKKHPGQPVLILSGDVDMDTVREALASGAHTYITKPFDVEDLQDAVSALTGNGHPAAPERRPWRVKPPA
ncbi:MAG: response regulator [Actinomycetota bacterium]